MKGDSINLKNTYKMNQINYTTKLSNVDKNDNVTHAHLILSLSLCVADGKSEVVFSLYGYPDATFDNQRLVILDGQTGKQSTTG